MHACMQSCFSRVWLCTTLWTAVHQAPPSTGFSRQEYWSGLPFPSPRDHKRTPKTHQKCSFQLGYLNAYTYVSLGAFHNVSTPEVTPPHQHSPSLHEACARFQQYLSKALLPQHDAALVCHLCCEQHCHLGKLCINWTAKEPEKQSPHFCTVTDTPPEVTHLLRDAHKDPQLKSALRSRLRPALGGRAPPRPSWAQGAGRLLIESALEPNLDDLGTSYLKNLRDGGAWWAAVYGATQSRTRLK